MSPVEPVDLCVPIYLNQKIVFDLLAMLEDGFSQLSTVKTSTSESDTQKSGYGGSVGASNIFAFLGVSLKGERSKEKGTTGQHEATAERIHTPNSLFFKLRSLLKESELITKVEKLEDIEGLSAGCIVEFRALLRKNPLVDYIETFKRIPVLVDLAAEESQAQQTGNSGKKGKGKKPAVATPNPKQQQGAAYQQMETMETALKESDALEVIGEMLDIPNASAVLSTNVEYFNDRNASEMVDGEFRVLGKTVKVVGQDSNESINLLRKTAFGRFHSEVFDELSKVALGVQEMIDLPEFKVEIVGPAIQVIPIAIFI